MTIQHWIKTEGIEVSITTAPRVRLTVLRKPGGDNFLDGTTGSLAGLRTWIMNPVEDHEHRAEVAELAAEVTEHGPDRIRLKTAPSPVLGLVLEWQVRINAQDNEVIVRQTILNSSNVSQEISVWSLLVVSEGAEMHLPLDHPGRMARSKNPFNFFLFPYSSINDPRMSVIDDKLTLSVGRAPDHGALKVGVVSASGMATIRHRGMTLKSRVDFDPDGTYPEGGPSITAFLIGSENTTLGEFEHMSPIQTIAPGESVSMTQHLSLLAD